MLALGFSTKLYGMCFKPMYGMYSCQLVLRCYFCRYICIYFTPSISMFLVFYLSSFCHSDGLCAFKLFGREGVDEKHLYNLQGKIVKVLLIFCSRCWFSGVQWLIIFAVVASFTFIYQSEKPVI